MILRTFFLSLSLPFILYNAFGQGIVFEKDLDFTQVKQKAAREHKLIFIDFWATWCMPCLQMNKEVYNDAALGNFFNERFVSVKIQMDEKSNDSDELKAWRIIGKEFTKQFDINLYPFYLFFTADGKLLHRDLGFRDVAGLTDLANIALTPNRQYTAKLEMFRAGKLPLNDMPDLFQMANIAGDRKVAMDIGRYYFDNYLNKLSDKKLSDRAVIEFIIYNQHLLQSKDKFFSLCYRDPSSLDSIYGPNTANSIILQVVRQEEINPHVLSSPDSKQKTPDWRQIRSNIRRKYNRQLADVLVLNAQIDYSQAIKDWERFSVLYSLRLKKDPVLLHQTQGVFGGRLDGINTAAWDVFEGSDNPVVLQRALKWSKLTVEMGGQTAIYHFILDTYANLLYKLGRKEEAVIYQQRAIIEEEKSQLRSLEPSDEKVKTLKLMKAGAKTWP